MSLQSNIKHQANIADLSSGEVLEDGYQIEKFVIVSIREPAADWDGVLGVEDVGRRRVVDDDGLFEVSANLRQVLCNFISSCWETRQSLTIPLRNCLGDCSSFLGKGDGGLRRGCQAGQAAGRRTE